MLRVSGAAAGLLLLVAVKAQERPPLDPRATIAERVATLTRESPWRAIRSVPIAFRMFHPQGLVKIGDTLFVSSVEVRVPTRRLAGGRYDRDAGDGVGHLFKMDLSGRLLADTTLGDGALYHPGGLDYDGRHIWVPVAEYRPDSRSIVYRIDPATLKATQVLEAADHLGAVIHDTDDNSLHGVSWGSRRFYRWQLRPDGAVANAAAQPPHTVNPSHYVDYQDCKYVGRHRMLCTGVAELRQSPNAPPFRLGGLELVDLQQSRQLHQVPVPLWTQSGLDMTHNPSWFERSASGLRAYFMPEDDASSIYVFETR